MFNRNDSTEKTKLEEAIDELFNEMSNLSGDDPAYAKMVDQLDTLYKLKEVDHKVDVRTRVSADTLAIVVGNLAAVVLIVGHERANVITTKALSFLAKTPR